MPFKHRHGRRVSLLVASSCMMAFGSLPADAREELTIEPFPLKTLQRMALFLSSAERLTFEVVSETVDVAADGLPSRLKTDVGVAVRRPDRLFVDVQSDEVQTRITSDGKLIRIHDRLANTYSTRATPGGVEEILGLLEEKLGVSVPMGALLRRDPLAEIMEGVTDLSYVGLDDVTGVSCHHVTASQDDLAWELWIEAGPHPVPRKLVLHFRDGHGTSIYTGLIRGWSFSPHLPDGVFQPPLAEDAREVPLRETPRDED